MLGRISVTLKSAWATKPNLSLKKWKNGGNQMISLVPYSIPKLTKSPSLFKGVIPGWDYGTVDKVAHCTSAITWVSIHRTHRKKLGAVIDIWTSSIGGLEIDECLHHTGQPVYWSWWAPGLMKYLGSKNNMESIWERNLMSISVHHMQAHTYMHTHILHNGNNNTSWFWRTSTSLHCV